MYLNDPEIGRAGIN